MKVNLCLGDDQIYGNFKAKLEIRALLFLALI